MRPTPEILFVRCARFMDPLLQVANPRSVGRLVVAMDLTVNAGQAFLERSTMGTKNVIQRCLVVALSFTKSFDNKCTG
jgi:hypothetical protein